MIQGVMDCLVCQGIKAPLEFQAGKDCQDLQGILESKVSLVQGDMLDMLEIRYNEASHCLPLNIVYPVYQRALLYMIYVI